MDNPRIIHAPMNGRRRSADYEGVHRQFPDMTPTPEPTEPEEVGEE